MKKREKSETGTITSNGNLSMYMGELNSFFKMWKGYRVIARFIVASPGSSEALKGYYFNYIVPTMRAGYSDMGERYTEEQTEMKLREMSPIMYNQVADINTGKYSTEIRNISDLSNPELIEHIDTIKQIAAENFGIFIEDPRIL